MKIIVSTSYFDEDKYVKEYMAKYGIENVRGGTYSNIVLDDNSILVLEKEIRHSKNLCTRCGRNTHFIKHCYANTDSNGVIIEAVKKDIKKPNVKAKAKAKKKVKDWSDNNSNCDSDSDGNSDSDDEAIQVITKMTYKMLKNARKNRNIYEE